MWNRVISSTYAHLVTAIAVTLGLVLVVLTAHPKRVGLAEVNGPARSAPLAEAARGSILSQTNFRNDRPAGPSSIRLLQDDRSTGRAP